MTRIGMIPIANMHGVQCPVQYCYDLALGDYFLVPNKRFTVADVQRVKKTMPNLIQAMIFLHIIEQTRNGEPKTSRPTDAPAQNRTVCGLTGGHKNA